MLRNKYGGIIERFPQIQQIDKDHPGQPTPDFLWNGKYWELKNPCTEKAFNSAVRKALKQLQAREKIGGVVLDFPPNIKIDKAIKIIDARVTASYKSKEQLDIILLSEGRIKRILRY